MMIKNFIRKQNKIDANVIMIIHDHHHHHHTIVINKLYIINSICLRACACFCVLVLNIVIMIISRITCLLIQPDQIQLNVVWNEWLWWYRSIFLGRELLVFMMTMARPVSLLENEPIIFRIRKFISVLQHSTIRKIVGSFSKIHKVLSSSQKFSFITQSGRWSMHSFFIFTISQAAVVWNIIELSSMLLPTDCNLQDYCIHTAIPLSLSLYVF